MCLYLCLRWSLDQVWDPFRQGLTAISSPLKWRLWDLFIFCYYPLKYSFKSHIEILCGENILGLCPLMFSSSILMIFGNPSLSEIQPLQENVPVCLFFLFFFSTF